MIEGLGQRDELLALARQKARDYDAKSLHVADLEIAIADGWSEQRRGKRTVRVTRPKAKPVVLEDRVWMLMYRLGFAELSGERGAVLSANGSDPEASKNQLDCVAIDTEVALAVECKSFQDPKRDPKFQEKLSKFALLRKPFSDAIRSHVQGKRQVGSILFTWDIISSESDTKRSEELGIVLFNERDLAYYEALVDHLGPAARYQFLADVFPGKQIPGLELRVPALRAKMGKITCYSFSLRPEYLLKIAFVSHRARGHATDVDAYQRMIQKNRLKKIREYISDDGIFPTNIVLNMERAKYTRFDVGEQEVNDQAGRFGWLTISPAYKSAWVIDGQHRLFAYSGHPRADSSYLHVVAFEGLSGSTQAKLFVDINHEQKSVKRSLLDELWAELHWEAEDQSKRIRAIISKAVQGMNADPESPLCGRVLMSDAAKTDIACISLTSLISALDKPGLFLLQSRKNVAEPGPLWANDNEATLRRTTVVVNGWLRSIATRAKEWWDLGAGIPGGGLAMNDGVTACINVLRSVLDHLSSRISTPTLTDHELVTALECYSTALGEFFAAMTSLERDDFRRLRGIQGQTTARRMCEIAIHEALPHFNPDGLQQYIEQAKSNTNERARKLIDEIERLMQDTIISTLKEEYGEVDDGWWFEGVPKSVRKKVDEQINESDGKAGSREQNFNLIHYRDIILQHWALFEKLFARGAGGKDKRTSWISEVSTMRNTVMHPSRREYLTPEKLSSLETYTTEMKLALAKEFSDA